MDRLIKPDIQTIELFFTKNQKCSKTFKLTNLMHTMPVAISLTTSTPSLFSFSHPFSIIPPLSTSSFTLLSNKPSDKPPLTSPPDTILVRASMLPTGKAHQDDLRRLFSKPGPHIFKDAVIPISFVGPDVAEYLLSSTCCVSKSLDADFYFSKAISCCDDQPDGHDQIGSLLRTAAINGKSRFISSLIEAGGDVNARDLIKGESLVSLAVKSGKAEAVRILIESGCRIDNGVDRLLHEAAVMNRVDLMEILCLGYPDIELNSANCEGQTALHISAIHCHMESLQFLVSIGSDVDVVDFKNWTPLHYAAVEGHFDVVEFLLSHSTFAKYAVTKEGKTAFALAVDKGHSYLYDLLHLGDSLHRAARINDVHSMKSCLAQGAKVNGRDQNGWTPLHRAAFKGHMESVKLLIGHGAQVDLVDGTGYTALLRAVEAGNVEVAMCLLSHGAKASLKSLKGIVSCDDHMESFKNHSSFLSLECIKL